MKHAPLAPQPRDNGVVLTSLPLLGQQLSTIMAHGISHARDKAAAIRWTVRRTPGIRLAPLAAPVARDGHGPCVAMLTFDDDSAPPLLVDAFEAALFEAAADEIAISALLHHGFEAEIRPVEAAFAAIERLVAAGVFVRGGG